MGKIIIKDFDDYCVDEMGNVYSYKYGYEKKLKPQIDKYGYLTVCLRKNKKTFNIKVHRIVAEAFIENKYNKITVNHKNGIKSIRDALKGKIRFAGGYKWKYNFNQRENNET